MPRIKSRVAATIILTTIASGAIHGRSLMRSDDVFALSGEPLPGPSSTLRTQSSALDRIGKREPALDSTTWRTGTGRGTYGDLCACANRVSRRGAHAGGGPKPGTAANAETR